MENCYTIGIYLNTNLDRVVLIEKERPNWQKGKFNFPGGHVEMGETFKECISREFLEECGVQVNENQWQEIANIHNYGNYTVGVLVAVQRENHDLPKTTTDEKVKWFDIDKLPENIITNVRYLVPLAVCYLNQGNIDDLVFAEFTYSYPNKG